MREPTPSLFAGSRNGEVEGLRYGRLASTGRRTAGHHVDGASDRDHTDTVARVRKVGETGPRAGRGVEHLDLPVRSAGLLAADEDQATADHVCANAAARRRRIGHRFPPIRTRVIA